MIPYEHVATHLLEELPLRLPFHRYAEVFRERSHSILLDSASDPQKLGTYSVIGADPFLIYKAKRVPRPGHTHAAQVERIERVESQAEPHVTRYVVDDPFVDLRALLARHRVDPAAYAARPVPFLGGALGYFGYEAGYFIEKLPDTGADELALPDIYLLFVDTVLVHDHRTSTSYLSVLGRGSSANVARGEAERTRDRLLGELARFEKSAPPAWEGAPPSSRSALRVTAQFDEASYSQLVHRAKAHIEAGDVFEICLSHRMQARLQKDPWQLYQELRRINPAPFACYLQVPEATVVSSSPERFLKLDADRVAESRPIKGTRPRGATDADDRAAVAELASSVKDRAENTMIVDLVRSDFGRVCRFGSIHVPELRIIESYATVHQMVSTICGRLDDDKDAIDLIRACFPGGSMTGAPKIEALKIIDRLEPVKRSVYAGALGCLDFSGTLDLNIVIRTIILQSGIAYFHVGGAIVADSEAKAEYQETLDKARALIAAMSNLLPV